MNRSINDPDLNLQSFNDHGIFTMDELDELSSFVKPHLSAFHFNIRSLNQHFTELCNFLDHTSFVFDFIGCSETWITPQTDLDCLKIPGYTFVNDNRSFSSVIGKYFWNDLPFSIRNISSKTLFKKAVFKYYFAQY